MTSSQSAPEPEPEPEPLGMVLMSMNCYDSPISCYRLLFCIDTKSMGDVLEMLYDVTKWKDLGLALKLDYATLKKIDADNHGKTDDCKREMVDEWLRGKGDPPTWKNLARALRKLTVGRPDVAERIEREILGYQST